MPGFKQKAAWAAARQEAKEPRLAGDHQLRQWLSAWAWGGSPAVHVVSQAHSHVLDHGKGKGLDARVTRLAKCYRSPANAEQVVESILPVTGMPKTKLIEDSLVEHVLLPHEMWGWLQDTNPSKFAQKLGAREGGIADWWAELLAQPLGPEMWVAHPWLKDKSPKDLQ